MLSVTVAPVFAAASVWVPAGTQVGLQFLSTVASDKIEPGARVRFRIAADVIKNRKVVIRSGTAASGTVTRVQQPGAFGQDASVVIGFIEVNGVDGRPIKLSDVVVSKATLSKGRVGAAGTSVAGMIVLGPVGLLACSLVRVNNVEVPAGAVVTETVRNGVYVRMP
jgi:hypothetical protein